MIVRDVARAAHRELDLIIIGGGIYGASLLHEAARRGLSACLCEARDFGSGTSQNSLRILHGGLRYLQTLDLRRFFQSVAARRSVARRFPGLVRPLSCLMPLYGPGLKRPSVMRIALGLNDGLSLRRNAGLARSVHLGAGEILSAAATRRAFPIVRTAGLLGAARWRDYFMVSSERILIEMLRDACSHGAMALNYSRVDDLVVEGGAVRGVRITDTLTGAQENVRGRQVVNCTGPAVDRLAARFGGNGPTLFQPSLAFNVLLEAALPGDSALAVAAPEPGAPILFAIPQGATVLAGTMHLPRPAGTLEAVPSPAELQDFLRHLRAAIPGLDVRLEHVRRVFAGLLPARAAESAALVKREVLVDHARAGGPRGFYSVSGVKFTTAGDVASQVMSLLGHGGRRRAADTALPISAETDLLTDARRLWTDDQAKVREALHDVVREESVQSLDDLILRRTNWATTEPHLERLRERLAEIGTGLAMDSA
jgi:glycerol-3-phosphate dehydrogenase